jgi:hypothetical protein
MLHKKGIITVANDLRLGRKRKDLLTNACNFQCLQDAVTRVLHFPPCQLAAPYGRSFFVH